MGKTPAWKIYLLALYICGLVIGTIVLLALRQYIAAVCVVAFGIVSLFIINEHEK